MQYSIKELQTPLTTPEQTSKILQQILKNEQPLDQDKEHFWAIGLNSRNVIQYVDLTALGTADAALVHPRETFRLAVMKNVTQIILSHNHPSGAIDPSEGDIILTQQLVKAGEILGIKVIDHLIISKKSSYSFKENKLI